LLLRKESLLLIHLLIGLGELTFLQLSTVYHPASVAGSSVSSFASGTGAAGLVGAFMWWELRGLGVRTGVGISAVSWKLPNSNLLSGPYLHFIQVLPFVIPVMYHLVLAPPSVFCEFEDSASVSDGDGATYQAVPTTQPDQDHDMGDSRTPTVAESSASRLASTINISTQEKWTLAKPLLLQYMLPLCTSILPSMTHTCS
jgi:battenin